MDEQMPEAVQEMPTAYEAIHARVLLTLTLATHPTPDVHWILENRANFGSLIPQISEQLARKLGKTLAVCDLTGYEGKDSTASAALAREDLAWAARLAEQLGGKLAQARNAIAGQGYRTALEHHHLEEFRRGNTGC